MPPQTTTTELPSSPVSSTTLTETPEPPSSTTESPKVNETDKGNSKVEGDSKDGKSSAACNHLPTYEADEVQKVFREETTYKNGTIKGKFTYINFDQRYRLVHYTRLPYGPVKIDLVEELARPEKTGSGNRTTAPSSNNDIPNAVLQLRNILPNSLYGFPFLSPNNNLPLNSRSSLDQKNEDDKSNMYMYHTDSMTPSVPVPVPATQRKLGQGVDTLAPSFYENFSVGSPAARSDLTNERTKQQVLASSDPIFGGPNHSQFQYAGAPSQMLTSSPEPRTFYTYLSQPNYHQYSPLPIYSFNQPAYFTSRQTLASPATLNAARMRHEPSHSEAAFVSHQSHQPHSHEHFIAPFMYAHPPTIHGDQLDSSRLRLKVKTSKSLNYDNHEPVGRSAQLRASPKTHSVPIIQGPGQVHRYQYVRQRSGKQNHELTKTTANTAPVVYHVLRSPVGRMYNLPQYNSQAYSMAYDS